MTAFLELQQQDRPQTRRWPRRRRMLALAGVAAATAVTAAGLVVAQPDPKPAFALNPNGDGSVTFTINDAADPDGATAALRAAGIRAVVLPGHKPGECPPDQRGTRDARHWSSLMSAYDSLEYRRTHPDALRSVVIRPERIPDGSVLVIGTISGDLDGERVVAVYPELFTAPAPGCYETDLNIDKLINLTRQVRGS